MRGEAIQLITELETYLDIILVGSFIKSEYAGKFFEILMWEDFRLSTKVRLFEKIDMPKELQVKQKEIARTLQNNLLPTRNKYAHREAIIVVFGGVGQTTLVDKRYKMVPISPKNFRLFRKNCKRVKRMLQEIAVGIIDSESTDSQREE